MHTGGIGASSGHGKGVAAASARKRKEGIATAVQGPKGAIGLAPTDVLWSVGRWATSSMGRREMISATTSMQSGLRCNRPSTSSKLFDRDPTVERMVRHQRVICKFPRGDAEGF
jgi:hypothetical protein